MSSGLFMLCSREMSFSVDITPAIFCIWWLSSTMRCALSRAYSLTSMVYGPVVKWHSTVYNALVSRAAVERYSHVGARAVAHALRAYVVARTGYHAAFYHAQHPLVHCRARHVANLGNVLEWHARVAGYYTENLLVVVINFLLFRFHGYIFFVLPVVLFVLNS